MPVNKHATIYVEMLDTDEVREILRSLAAENKRLRDELDQMRALADEDYRTGASWDAHNDGSSDDA